MSLPNKIGFWSVVSLVLGSQIGSGIFMLPAGLSIYGSAGLVSWVISGTGAVLLALVFAELCKLYPRTGGPHAYVSAAFGSGAGFFTAWSYWIISWVSSSVVVIAAISYFSTLFGGFSPYVNLMLEISLLLIFMGINLLGVRTSGQAEFIFTILKIVPLVILPIACIPFINIEYFTPFNPSNLPTPKALSAAALFTFWGFIGLETATTPAGSVENPTQTIPRAITMGTLAVALIYLFNSGAIMGVVSQKELISSTAPFSDVTRIIFGGNWHYIIAIVAAIVCVGTLNAWILTSGQIALGAAQDRLFPALFHYQNKHQAPVWGIVLSTLGVIPLLFFTLQDSLVQQLMKIIDISVTAFLLIYGLCILSYLKLCYQRRMSWLKKALGWLAAAFCGWTLWASDAIMLGLSLLVFMTGIPIYYRLRHQFSQ